MVMPAISKQAGKKHINIAGLPIFFRLLISKDKPDLVKIMTKAICLRCDEIDRNVSSTMLSTDGPIRTPRMIYHTNFGSLIFSKKKPPRIPPPKMINKDKNIFIDTSYLP